MKQVVYTGRKVPGKIRALRVQDLEQLGIKSHKGEDLVWGPDNRYTLVMSNQLSDSLVDKLPNEFAAYDAEGEDESLEVEVAATSITESGAGSPEDSPDESLESADDEVQSSTRKGSKNK